MSSGYRPEFEAAPRAFARVSEATKRRRLLAPVLVGGAAVEVYTNSAVATGDIDVATPSQDAFEEDLRAAGFRPRRRRQGRRDRRLRHARAGRVRAAELYEIAVTMN